MEDPEVVERMRALVVRLVGIGDGRMVVVGGRPFVVL